MEKFSCAWSSKSTIQRYSVPVKSSGPPSCRNSRNQAYDPNKEFDDLFGMGGTDPQETSILQEEGGRVGLDVPAVLEGGLVCFPLAGQLLERSC